MALPANPAPQTPTAISFADRWKAFFATNTLEQIDEVDFQNLAQDIQDTFTNSAGLSTNQVRGSVFRLDNIILDTKGRPTLDTNKVPAGYRILGMDARAINGVTLAAALTGVVADPIDFRLVRHSTGLINALINEKAGTTTTVPAVWVRTSGTATQKALTFPELIPENHPYLKGDVVQFTLPGGQTRLFEWRADSTTTVHPTPTGLDTDPIYKPFAPLEAPTGITQAQFDAAQALRDTAQAQLDANTVHLTGDETITGLKTFTNYLRLLFNNATLMIEAAALRVYNTSYTIYTENANLNLQSRDGDVVVGQGAYGAITPYLTVKNNGNVGIGTNSPLVGLDVQRGSIGTIPSIRTTADMQMAEGASLFFGEFGYNLTYIGKLPGGSFAVASGGQRTTFAPNGNVGIGVDVPTSKLQVNGMITSMSGGFKFPDGSRQMTAYQNTLYNTDFLSEGTVNLYYLAAKAALKANLASPQFTGTPTVPTMATTNNSLSIANTAYVSALVTPLLNGNAVAFRTTATPLPLTVFIGTSNGDQTIHDLLMLRGMIGNLYLKNRDYNISGYTAIVDSVWIVDGGVGRTIIINGLTSRGTWFIHESGSDGTTVGIVATMNFCTIPTLMSFQSASGGARDKHTFNQCNIGRLGRAAAYNGVAGHTLDFNRCSFGNGITSGAVIGDYAPGEMSARFYDCTIRLFGTATADSGASVYPNVQYHNCTVIRADGTNYRLDNTASPVTAANAGVVSVAVRTGSELFFDKTSEYLPITSTTFTANVTSKIVGAVVVAYLTPGTTDPTVNLPATQFQTKSVYTAGKNLEYVFKVGANGFIQYTINVLD